MEGHSRLDAARLHIDRLRAAILRNLQEKNDAELATVAEDLHPAAALHVRARCTFSGHRSKVYAMQWSEMSHKIISVSQDATLRLWEGLKAQERHRISLSSSWSMTCAVSPNESLLAWGGLGNVCEVFRLESWRSEAVLSGHRGFVSCCRFISERELVTSSGDGSCKLWDIERAEVIQDFKDHGFDVMAVSLSPANRNNVFVSVAGDSTAKLWDRRSGECLTFTGHESDINAVSFFPSGDAFCTGSDDATSRLFDIRAFRQLQQFGSDDIICAVTSCALSSSGRYLFAGYDSFSCIMWDVLTGEKIETLHGHKNRISCVGVSFDGKALGTGSWDSSLNIWA